MIGAGGFNVSIYDYIYIYIHVFVSPPDLEMIQFG